MAAMSARAWCKSSMCGSGHFILQSCWWRQAAGSATSPIVEACSAMPSFGTQAAVAAREGAGERGVEVDRATVYRTVDMLKRHGLVDELDLMHLQGEKHYYEVRTRRD